MEEKEYYMKQALKEAEKAYQKLEVPVGAVIVKDGKIIARAHNQKETKSPDSALGKNQRLKEKSYIKNVIKSLHSF